MSLPEIAVWTAVSAFLVLRIAMLGAFLAMPVVIFRAVHRQTEA
jgi:hypothetical protein